MWGCKNTVCVFLLNFSASYLDFLAFLSNTSWVLLTKGLNYNPCLPLLPIFYLRINTWISHPLPLSSMSLLYGVTNKPFHIRITEWKELLAQLLVTVMCSHAESDLCKVKINLDLLVYLVPFSTKASLSAQYSAFVGY